MRHHNLPRHRQSDSGAPDGRGLRSGPPHELLKDLFLLRRWNAETLVAHPYQDPRARLRESCRTVVSGVRNSCDTAATKSDCNRATVTSRKTARLMKYPPANNRTAVMAIPASRSRVRPESSGGPNALLLLMACTVHG